MSWNLFRLKKEQNYYNPVRVNNFWSIEYNIEYKSNGDRNKTLSVEEYLYKIRPYLKDTIDDVKSSDTWKIQLTITINFITSKDDNDKKRVIYSEGDNMKIMNSDEGDEVIKNFLIHLKIDVQIV